MTRLRGWSPRESASSTRSRRAQWKTHFLAALRNDRIDAPCLFDGPINGERFHAYVEQFSVPTLKPGDVVSSTISAPTRKGGAEGDPGCRRPPRLCRNTRPTYPIEQVFAKFKTAAKGGEAKAISELRQILAQYPPAECAYPRAGYARPKQDALECSWHSLQLSHGITVANQSSRASCYAPALELSIAQDEAVAATPLPILSSSTPDSRRRGLLSWPPRLAALVAALAWYRQVWEATWRSCALRIVWSVRRPGVAACACEAANSFWSSGARVTGALGQFSIR